MSANGVNAFCTLLAREMPSVCALAERDWFFRGNRPVFERGIQAANNRIYTRLR